MIMISCTFVSIEDLKVTLSLSGNTITDLHHPVWSLPAFRNCKDLPQQLSDGG